LCFSSLLPVSSLSSAGKIEKSRIDFREEDVVVVVVERDIDIARHWCGVALSLSLLLLLMIVDGGWQLLPSASAIVTYATDSPQI
jgi:hypothetical protein